MNLMSGERLALGYFDIPWPALASMTCIQYYVHFFKAHNASTESLTQSSADVTQSMKNR